jgi:hypothetical protein
MRVERSAHLWVPLVTKINAELPCSKEERMAKKTAKGGKKKGGKKR